MHPDRWQAIESAFHHAASLDQPARSRYLASLPGDLRDEVDSLLAAESQPLTVSGEIAATLAEIDLPQTHGGQRLGPWRILAEIGSGGMGTVYKAIRDDDQYQKTVAVKIIRTALAQTRLEARFRAERQILAQLDHPFIAGLLDGGAHNGLPYLVMEYVEGQPIDQFAANSHLSLKDRIILFRKVCSAVAHAHQRLIVHRDLKPGNILVLADGTPRLLDFGIAKLLDQDPTEAPLTQTGWFLMTPDYASPEQIKGEAINVSSDVYSLGVILYELLAGRRPYNLKTYSPTELQRAICTGNIPRPELNSDLDTILLKALHIDPARRYSSVTQLDDDLRRYLDGEPISARPDTFLYRSSKFIRRNRIAVALSAVLLLTTLLGAFLVYREGLRAQRRFTQVRALANRVLTEFDPEASKLPNSVKLRSTMVRASMEYLDSLAAESSSDPELIFDVAFSYSKVGDTLGFTRNPNLGQPFEAVLAYSKALRLLEQIPNHPRTKDLEAYTYAHYAATARSVGKPELTVPYYERAIALLPHAQPVTVFETRHGFANYLMVSAELDRAATIAAPLIGEHLPSLGRAARLHSYNLVAEIEASRGNLKEAIRATDAAIALSNAAPLDSIALERASSNLFSKRSRLAFSYEYPSEWQPCAALPSSRRSYELQSSIQEREPTRSVRIAFVTYLLPYLYAQAACDGRIPQPVLNSAHTVYAALQIDKEPIIAAEALAAHRRGDSLAALNLLQPLLARKQQMLTTLLVIGEVLLALNRPADTARVLAPSLDFAHRTASGKLFDAILYRERALPLALMLGDALTRLNRAAEARRIWADALAAAPLVAPGYPLAPSTSHWQSQLSRRLQSLR